MAGDKMREDQLQAVWFAAGMAAVIACIERAVVVSLFAHWRVWAFLALNLLLLAILFTSKSQIRSSREVGEEHDEKKGEQEEFKPVVATAGGGGGCPSQRETRNVEEDVKKEDDDHERISKEELNQRAEAFIAKFRQHLVSDAKNFRSRKQLNSHFSQSHFSQSKIFIRT